MKPRNLLRIHAFSEDRVYRYTLWREWDVDSLTGCSDDLAHADKFVQFIGLNPSTADETLDDPTLRKCIGFAKRWGYGAMCMTNLFAFRATDPRDMKASLNPTGIHNYDHLEQCAKEAGLVVAAWGTHGTHMKRDAVVREFMRQRQIPLKCLGLTQDGHPKHPLYVPYETKLIEYT